MRRYLIVVLCLLLTACSGTLITPRDEVTSQTVEPEKIEGHIIREDESPAGLPDLGEAPELENEIWLNVDRPLRLGDLRGKVVLLDMWTFG